MHLEESPRSLSTGISPLLGRLAGPGARALLIGPPGSGKSTLAARLAAGLAARGRSCHCLNADPGSPAFGLPAALNLGRWSGNGWQPVAFEALCSLDAARFRLPLLQGIQRLLSPPPPGPLLVDMPGVVRGVAGAELLTALTEALQPDLLVSLWPPQLPDSLSQELASLALPLVRLDAAAAAKPPSASARAALRTRLWQDYLQDAAEYSLPLNGLPLLGTPPPLDLPDEWCGRLVAPGQHGSDTTMAEVTGLGHTPTGIPFLTLRGPAPSGPVTLLLVRDACHPPGKPLSTRPPVSFPVATKNTHPPPSGTRYRGRPLVVKTPSAIARMVNGVFGDPLLLLELQQSRRCLLFDLGDSARLPLRCAHRVSDVFISHAHLDHIGGFFGLLRAQLGSDHSLCRLFGPPGLAGHVAGMLDGVLWDRIDDRGPVFEIAERHGNRLRRFRLQAGGDGIEPLSDRVLTDDVILLEPDFRVRCVPLDHRTPVLAYAFEPTPRWQLNEAALRRHGPPPGAWLEQLVEAAQQDDLQRPIALPDGRHCNAGELARQLLIRTTRDRLIFATDLADTPQNRSRLVALADGARILFCEASFSVGDADRARQHGHLTTRACGEIAATARVRQLAPFHFSKRYETRVDELYREIAEALGAGTSIELVRS